MTASELEGTVASPTLTMLLQTLANDGVDTSELLRRCGIEADSLADPDGRVPARSAARLWEEAVVTTKNADLGLRVAEARSHGSLGVFDYAIAAAKTLGEGWNRLARYFRLVHSDSMVELEPREDVAILRHRMLAPIRPPRPIAEMVLGSATVLGRRSTQVAWHPLEVRFAHPRPSNISAHQSLFRSPLVFSAGEDALVVPRSVLDLQNQRADPALSSLMRRYADDLLDRLSPNEDVLAQVRRAVLQSLPESEPRVEKVARALGMGPRTLHRRLQSHGTSFQRIVDELRLEMAKLHLADERLAISEIAYLLGFSEPSAFHRAFRRWTGQTPTAWRKRGGARP